VNAMTGQAAVPSSARKERSRSKTERRAAIRVARRFRATPQRVFDAWLDPEIAGDWLLATALRPMTRVKIDARVGGSFRFVDRQGSVSIEHTGEYLEIVPHRRLAFTLSVARHPGTLTRVVAEFAPARNGCALTLTHENVPPDCVQRTEARWIGSLYGLGEMLAARRGSAN
jgi:uncharacterized protein YndB with AHSA1/START domain